MLNKESKQRLIYYHVHDHAAHGVEHVAHGHGAQVQVVVALPKLCVAGHAECHAAVTPQRHGTAHVDDHLSHHGQRGERRCHAVEEDEGEILIEMVDVDSIGPCAMTATWILSMHNGADVDDHTSVTIRSTRRETTTCYMEDDDDEEKRG